MIAAPGLNDTAKKFLLAIWVMWQGILLYIIFSAAKAGVLSLGGLGLMLLFSVIGTVMLGKQLFSYPTVTFDEDGVHWQVATIHKVYPWADLTALGLLYVKNKAGNFPALVVAKPGGKPWDGDPGSFRFHNRGKLIFVPYSDDLADYAEEYYGQLDFTLVRR